MPLLVAGLIPHSPLLIPEIGRSNQKFLNKNISAYNFFSEKILENEIETIIIISPHGQVNKEIAINISPEMKMDFKDFGYINETLKINGDSRLADKLFTGLKDDYQTEIVANDKLDYGSAVPSCLFQKNNKQLKLVAISVSEYLSLNDCSIIGKKINSLLKLNEKKIAVFASGDLSHSLQRKSPAGYNPKANKFDHKIIDILSDKELYNKILEIDEDLAQEVSQCALKPLTILLNLLPEEHENKQLAYETEFGVGYLSFDLSPINKN